MNLQRVRSFAIKKSLLAWRRLIMMMSPVLASSQNTSHIWEESDWDIICILDACRPDVLEMVLDSEVPTVTSGASMSKPWHELTFLSETTPDLSRVALISGNPWAEMVPRDEIGYVHFEDVADVEYDEIYTVPPRPLAERAIGVWRDKEEYDIDQMIVHFMQPHIPLRSKPEWFAGMAKDGYGADIYWKLADGRISKNEFIDAYKDNTEWVLGEGVSPIANNCEGQIIITSDHSTGLGEWGIYSHPEGIPLKFIQVVPWVRFQATDRGTVSTVKQMSRSEEFNTQDQLRALGYVSES